MISTTYVKSCFGPCDIHHGSRHVHPQNAWVSGIPGSLTIAYQSGKWTRQLRQSRSRSEPALRFWDWVEVSHIPVAKRTQGLDNLYRHASLSVAATSARLFGGSKALCPLSGVMIRSASGHARCSAHALSIGQTTS